MAVNVQCPIGECVYTTGDHDPQVAAALLHIHGKTHDNQSNITKPKIVPPSIPIGCTTESFTYLKSRWESYKRITQLPASQHAVHLLNCCDEDLRVALYRVHQNQLQNLTEVQLISAIETLAVRVEKKIVARVKLLNMRQDRDQPIREFAAEAKGQAGICKYVKSHKCTNCDHNMEIDYSDDIVQDVIARGLSDNDIQLELLGSTNQDLSLEEIIQFVATKEAGKASASHISAQSASAIKSTYKRATNKPTAPSEQATKPNQPSNKSKYQQYTPRREVRCRNCGNTGHKGPGSGVCPAFGKNCGNCGIPNHFTKVCRRERKENAAIASIDDELNEILNMNDSDPYIQEACSASTHQ